MSKPDFTPSPESREKMVKHALANLKFPKEAAADEIDQLMQRVQDAVKRVHTLVQPIAQSQIDNGQIHTPQGRKAFKNTLVKFLCDEFKEFDKDELIFVMAIVHAQILSDNFV